MKKENKRRLSNWSARDRFTLGAMLAPFLIAFLVFMVIPVVASIVLSFFRFPAQAVQGVQIGSFITAGHTQNRFQIDAEAILDILRGPPL